MFVITENIMKYLVFLGDQMMKNLRWVGHVARMGDRYSAYRILVGTPERKRPRGRPRLVWMIILKLILKKDGSIDYIGQAQDRDRWQTLVNVVMNLRLPQNAWNSRN
jgi:hypothetical protein